MLIQISSGRGPGECELAVGLYAQYFLKQHPTAKIVEKYGGEVKNGFKSIVIEMASGQVEAGPIKWICPSPLRRHHPRKNWFIELSIIKTGETPPEIDPAAPFDKRDLTIQTFRCPGKGGQNVNKVETGVRIKHEPTGLVATSVTARTQYLNKKLALERLTAMLYELEQNEHNQELLARWQRHDALERGRPVAVFQGPDFRPAVAG